MEKPVNTMPLSLFGDKRERQENACVWKREGLIGKSIIKKKLWEVKVWEQQLYGHWSYKLHRFLQTLKAEIFFPSCLKFSVTLVIKRNIFMKIECALLDVKSVILLGIVALGIIHYLHPQTFTIINLNYLSGLILCIFSLVIPSNGLSDFCLSYF